MFKGLNIIYKLLLINFAGDYLIVISLRVCILMHVHCTYFKLVTCFIGLRMAI